MPIDIYEQYGFEPTIMQKPQNNSALGNFVNSAPFQGLLGAGDAVGNTVMGAGHLLNKIGMNPFENRIDPNFLQKRNQQFNPLQSGEGTAYNVGNFAGNVLPFFAGGELLKGGQALEQLSPLQKLLSGAGKWGTAGAIGDPNNPEKGAIVGGTLGAAGEVLPQGLSVSKKLLEGLKEKYNPQKLTDSLAENLKDNFLKTKEQSANLYDQVVNKYKNAPPMAPKESYNGINDINRDLINKPTKKYLSEYEENPNFYNAHKLQSQLRSQISEMKSPLNTMAEKDDIRELLDSHTNFKSFIDNYLKSVNPEDSNIYKNASDYYKNQVLPYNDNEALRKVVYNKIKTVEPQKLHDALYASANKTSTPDDHFISMMQKQLSDKLDSGETLGKIAPSRFSPASVGKVLTSPRVTNAIGSFADPYDKLRMALFSNLTQGNQ